MSMRGGAGTEEQDQLKQTTGKNALRKPVFVCANLKEKEKRLILSITTPCP